MFASPSCRLRSRRTVSSPQGERLSRPPAGPPANTTSQGPPGARRGLCRTRSPRAVTRRTSPSPESASRMSRSPSLKTPPCLVSPSCGIKYSRWSPALGTGTFATSTTRSSGENCGITMGRQGHRSGAPAHSPGLRLHHDLPYWRRDGVPAAICRLPRPHSTRPAQAPCHRQPDFPLPRPIEI